MPKFVFAYHGGSKPEEPAEIDAVMQAWGQWFESLGDAVIDGGNPVGPSTTVHSDLSVTSDGGSNPLSGYSLIAAKDIEDAINKAKNCPILVAGGSIEIAEAIEM